MRSRNRVERSISSRFKRTRKSVVGISTIVDPARSTILYASLRR